MKTQIKLEFCLNAIVYRNAFEKTQWSLRMVFTRF